MSVKIALCAGEPSGDEHGALLLAALRSLQPGCEVRGMGLARLRAAGLHMAVDAAEGAAVMGFSEALSGAGAIAAAFRKMCALLSDWKPGVLIIINFSDFNLRLAKEAKRRRIPVLFYIPPQVWAWRSSRVKTIDSCIDVLAVIFPFERDFYEQHGCRRAVYVGHPFADVYPSKRLSEEARRAWLTSNGFDSARPLALLFPGSRGSELKRHLGVALDAAAIVSREHERVQLALNAASDKDRAHFEEAVRARGVPCRVLQAEAFSAMQCASAGLIKSGTSNLQAAFCGLPISMFFRASALSAFIVRRLVKLKEYSIVNILRPGTIREITQEQVSAETLAEELERLLFDEERRQTLRDGYHEITTSLSSHDDHPAFAGAATASARTAKLALSIVR